MTGPDSPQFKVINDFVGRVIVEIINPLILLLTAGAFIVFIWGIFEFFIMNGGDATKRSEGRRAIGWGLVGFVVMFGVYGIINTVMSTAGLPGIQKLTQ